MPRTLEEHIALHSEKINYMFFLCHRSHKRSSNPTKVFQQRFCQATEFTMPSRAGVSCRLPLIFISFHLTLLGFLRASACTARRCQSWKLFESLNFYILIFKPKYYRNGRNVLLRLKNYICLLPTSCFTCLCFQKTFCPRTHRLYPQGQIQKLSHCAGGAGFVFSGTLPWSTGLEGKCVPLTYQSKQQSLAFYFLFQLFFNIEE